MKEYDHATFMDGVANAVRDIHNAFDTDQEKPPIYSAMDLLFRAFEIGHAIVGNLNMLVALNKRRLEIEEEREKRDAGAFANYIAEEIKRGVEKELAKPARRSYIGQGRNEPNINEEPIT